MRETETENCKEKTQENGKICIAYFKSQMTSIFRWTGLSQCHLTPHSVQGFGIRFMIIQTLTDSSMHVLCAEYIHELYSYQ